MNDLITIDKSKLIVAKDKSGELTLSVDAKEELKKIIELKEFAEELYEYAQTILSQKMTEHKIKKIVAGEIVVQQRWFGERYQVNEGTPEEFTKEVVYRKADGDKIDKFVEEKGELPQGVYLKDRNLKATISMR